MQTNDYYINEYVTTRGLSTNTKNNLKTVMNHYCKYQQATIHELLNEADQDEENRIRWKNRKLKTRLINYMNYLKINMTSNSAKHYFKRVVSFYRHHYIEVGQLPRFNDKNAIILSPITAKDLPDKEIIKQAVNVSKPLMKSLILFLASSGMSKVDALNLTIQSFITATSKYHDETEINKVLDTLCTLDNVIPVWHSRRSKTKKFFITFNSPEATSEIINYLQNRNSKKPLKPADKLFKIAGDYYTIKFEEINKTLGLGTVGDTGEHKGYNRFRGHMLRKFHASQLEKYGMSRYLINVLQGKSNNDVDDRYFFEDEEMLLNEYVNAMEGVLIFTEVNMMDKYSPEFVAMQEENEMLRLEVEKINQLKSDVEEIRSWYQY